MQQGLDELIAGVPDDLASGADVSASREVLEAYRLVAADAGWLRRVAEVIRRRAVGRGGGAAGRR